MMSSERVVSADDQVEDVVREHPTASSFLREWGVVCVQCGEPVWGSLGEIIAAKGLDVERVIAALNDHLRRA